MWDFLSATADLIIVGCFLVVFIGKYRELVKAQLEAKRSEKH